MDEDITNPIMINPYRKTPWSDTVVENLNEAQKDDRFHGYTCGNEHDGDRHLIATRAGWICPGCDYRQDWF